ncbi:uncharacterized protein LOC110457148 [Mizuhopecten yessoensis]|uniref:uncharacterized protein LOC110457148 n=1 Tax=Mizuhopecten yessoensis TaxID=6573 RepID=UPI000B45AF65|nr:uncharacterized protein LOC110457148 [Mizuhopecten yessoensis]
MTTSQYKGQVPFRNKGQTTCIHHKGTQLDHYCEECEVPVCINCVSTIHKRHSLCSLKEITPQKKKEIQKFIDKSEKFDLVQIDKYIASTDKHLKDNASHFEDLSQTLTMQTNKLKDDLDLLTAETLSRYQKMEEDNIKLLQTYKQDLELYDRQLKQQVKECKVVLQRGSDILIYDAGSEIQSSVTLPVKPTLGTASFSPNRNPRGHLEQALGKVNISDQGHGQALQEQERSVGSSAGQGLFSTQPQSNLKVKTPSTQQISEPQGRKAPAQQMTKGTKEVTRPVHTLLSETDMLEEWTSQCDIMSVCPTTDGQAWTSYSMSGTLTRLDKKGRVLQKVKQNTGISDISLSPTKRNLWACDLENNITELVSGRLVNRFSTHKTPLCICITGDTHVIVGMTKHISKFTSKGTLVLTTLAARTGKSLVCTPHRISECPVTHNVAVADMDIKRDGGEGKPHVVVMDTDFKKLFMYDGGIPQKYQHTPQTGGRQFDLYGVVYDSVGNLVIGDHENNRVFLISGSGEFLRLIHSSDYSTFAIGVDREDVLWAVFRGNNVKLLQYRS